MTENKTKGGGEQNLTVALRIRPMNEDEILIGATQIAHKVQKKMCVLMDPSDDPEDVLRANRSREKQFVYDYTFEGGATQEEVYKTTTRFLIPNVINGYNATVFAYGATGAGKTYTMLGSDDDPGIMARALNDLFLEMEKTKENMAYRVSMSYLEIYNEVIRDLLHPSSGLLDLREDAKGGVQVAGLSEVTAGSTHEVMTMLLMGNKERTQEPTAANKTSSRSHAVLQVIIKQQNRIRNTMQEVRTGKLFMIDLAGSERAANTHNRGKRMVEGAHINRSLLALGNCINALTDPKGSKYVNYRDSKLTRLLKDALGGNCKTVMIAHISPASIHFEESRNTLVYADRAKHIKTKVRRNVTDVSYHIAQYTNIISELREEIYRLRYKLQNKPSSLQTSLNTVGGSSANINTVQAEVIGSKREELTKLREQLLISFKDQMELRKSLMELNNASMEISLETNRNQLVISEWECERARASKRKEGGEDMFIEESKALELSGAGSDEISEPEDVKLAREEIKVLHDEKHRTEKLRSTVQKELEQAKVKTRRLEETIPQRVNTEDQREILNLLCKVHELEIENTEAQSACLLRDFQIKRKDIIISRYRQHQSLCDKIIMKQRQIMEENKMSGSKDLEELYDLYQIEKDERMMLREDTADNLGPELRLKAPSMISNYRSNLQEEIDQLRALSEEDERGNLLSVRSRDDDRLFSPSARSKQIKEGALSGAWRNNSNLGAGEGNDNLGSLHSPGRKSLEDRNAISTGTRSIAALAAKKRSKAHNDLLNLERQFGGEPRSLYRPSSDRGQKDKDYLSPSLLAKHDHNYEDLVLPAISKHPSEDNISTGTKQSENTDSTLPPIGNKDNYRPGRADLRRNRRTRGYDFGYSQQNGGYNKGKVVAGTGKTGKENKQSRSLSPPPRVKGGRPTSRSKSTSTTTNRNGVKSNDNGKTIKAGNALQRDKKSQQKPTVGAAKSGSNVPKQSIVKSVTRNVNNAKPPKGFSNDKSVKTANSVKTPDDGAERLQLNLNLDRSLTVNISTESLQQPSKHIRNVPIIPASSTPINGTRIENGELHLRLPIEDNLASPKSSANPHRKENAVDGSLTYRTSRYVDRENGIDVHTGQPVRMSISAESYNARFSSESKRRKDFFLTNQVPDTETRHNLKFRPAFIDNQSTFSTDITDPKPSSKRQSRKTKVNKVKSEGLKRTDSSRRKGAVPVSSGKSKNDKTVSLKMSNAQPKIQKDDSVLNIMGKPPTGARPKSFRSNIFAGRQEKRQSSRGKIRAKSDTDIPALRGGNAGSTQSGNKRLGKKNVKGKIPPTIPTYKRADIAITGFSFQK